MALCAGMLRLATLRAPGLGVRGAQGARARLARGAQEARLQRARPLRYRPGKGGLGLPREGTGGRVLRGSAVPTRAG